MLTLDIIHAVVAALQAFDVVEKSYFETIDDALAEKANLSNYLLPHNEVGTLYFSLLVSITTKDLGFDVS